MEEITFSRALLEVRTCEVETLLLPPGAIPYFSALHGICIPANHAAASTWHKPFQILGSIWT